MQSLKKSCLYGVLRKKAHVKVFSNEEIHRLSPLKLNMCNREKMLHIHDLPHILNNPMKFQLNQIRTLKSSIKTI